MINYRQGKKRYQPNDLGSLYIDESKLSLNEQPVIYIGGQMEHRFHTIEQMGITGDPGHNMFTGSWFYDYPLSTNNKHIYNAENFANNLIKALDEARLTNVVFITESFGGTIASYATKSDRVDKVIAIHPSILGTPLANPKYLEDYQQYFNAKQRAILMLLRLIVDSSYGFEQDNFNGLDLNRVDLDKLLVVGSYIDRTKEKNKIILELDDMIQKVSANRSDGIVMFEPRQFEQLGIPYMMEDEHINHFQAGSKEHIAKVYQKIMR